MSYREKLNPSNEAKKVNSHDFNESKYLEVTTRHNSVQLGTATVTQKGKPQIKYVFKERMRVNTIFPQFKMLKPRRN